MANCPGCGAVNEEQALHCVACGRVLGAICTQCQTKNSVSAIFCHHCGRVMKTDAAGNVGGEPINDMFAPGNPTGNDLLPKPAVIKALSGGAVFTLLFFSQVLRGYPLLAILSGLASGAIALWGIVEISIWFMDRYDRSTGKAVPPDSEEHFPETAPKDLGLTEGSFAELDKEVFDKTPMTPVLGQPDDMVSSMVSSETSPVDGDGEKDLSDAAEEDSPELPGEATNPKAQNLAEFLEDGIAHEIVAVEKKLLKSPRNFSLLMKRAQLHEERGELTKALEVMTQCISYSPQIPDAYVFYGVLLRRNQQFDEARESLEKALTLNRFLSKAHYQLGVLERARRNLQAGREAFQKCIQLAPDDAYAHYQLGMVYRETGEVALSQMELKRATMLNPADSYGHSQLGQVYQQMKQWDSAVGEYSAALSLKPNDAFVLEKLGEVLVAKDDLARAQEIFQEALAHQFHPELRTMLALARTMHRQGKIKELKPTVEEILRLAPNDPDGLFLRAVWQIDEKNSEGGLATLQQLVLLAPDRSEAWMEMGRLFQLLDRPEEALNAFIKASPSAPDQAGIWNSIGVLLSNQKRFEEALQAFRKAVGHDYSDPQIQTNFKAVQKKVEMGCRRVIEEGNARVAKDPEDVDAYLEMGRAYETLDHPEDALMVYQRLLALKPTFIPGLLSYANLLKGRGKLRMAVRCYREILKLQPKNIEAALQLIRADINLGFLNEALRQAMAAQKLIPDDPQLHFLLGKIFFAKGLAPRALKEFSIVAEKASDPDMVSWAELMRRRLNRTN